MKKVKINIQEGGCGCGPEPKSMSNAHHNEEARMHRPSLAKIHALSLHLMKMIEDGDDLPEWAESKITKASDYISSVKDYLGGNLAREMGALEEEVTDAEEEQLKKIKIQLKKASNMHKKQSEKIDDIIDEGICNIDTHYNLYDAVQDAIDENGESPCPQCLYEVLSEASCGCPDLIPEAMYRGKDVELNKPKRGGSKKFYVYVKKPNGKVVKVSFGDPNMRIKKSNPKRRKSFRARHNCKNPGPKWKARYWSCRKW